VVAALAAGGLVAGCGTGSEANGATPAADTVEATTRVVDVETVVLEPRAFVEYVTVTGDVRADREVVVAAEEAGVIREIFVERGARMNAGQPIARIDDTVLRAQFEQARAEAQLARETWERQRRLWEEDSIGSEIAYLRAKYGAETAEASARALEARLARASIRAPIAGVLDDRMIEVGSTVMPGSAVARIVDADPLKVIVGIPERYAGDFRTGGRALLAFDHIDGVLEGRLTFVGTAMDEQSRTFPVEIALSNAGGTLKPGMVARVQAPRRTLEDALVVPRDAVLRSSDGYIVYAVRDVEGKAVAAALPVTMGPGAEGRVVLTSGVQAGERVVVVGQQRLTEGDLVRATERAPGGSQ
jgi:RND family efflux transporter MFP subunit